jgi:GNAT superfamily N-acetyltransferase
MASVQNVSAWGTQRGTGHVRNVLRRGSRTLGRAWQANIAGPCHQVFGLFDGAHLIGITGVFGRGDTAYLVMSFILPAYRRRGLSAMLYQARLDWIRMHREFKRAVTAIRASNEVSQRVCQAFAFTCIGREAHMAGWFD